jgi:rod shape-determining protein MreD
VRRFFILFPIIAVLSLLQGIMRGIVVIGDIALVPDFALIFLTLFSVEFGRGVGQSAGWFGGLLEDFAMARPLGLSALIKMLLGSIFGSLHGRFMIGALVIAFWTVTMATLLKYLFTWMFSRIFGIYSFSLALITYNMLAELVLNLIFTLPIFWLTKKIMKSAAEFIRREQKI